MPKHLPTTAHFRDAGFSKGSDERIAAQARCGERRRMAEIRRGERPAVTNPEREQVLPADFQAEAMRKLAMHLGAADWEQSKRTIDAIAADWELQKLQDQSIPTALADRLHWHVTWLKLDNRTVNAIENLCCGTIGSLLECFPAAFIDVPMCGPAMIERIVKALCRVGVLSPEEAQRRMEEYAAAMGDGRHRERLSVLRGAG